MFLLIFNFFLSFSFLPLNIWPKKGNKKTKVFYTSRDMGTFACFLQLYFPKEKWEKKQKLLQKSVQLRTSSTKKKRANTILNLLCFTAPLSMRVLWVKSIQLALGNLDVSTKWYILQRTKLYLFIYLSYVHATTVNFISLKIGVKEKWEPWVVLNLKQH